MYIIWLNYIFYLVPIAPSQSELIEESSNSISLYLSSWKHGGCPIQYFMVEYTPKSINEWIPVSSNVKPEQKRLVIPGLKPSTWYGLRMTAQNSAGSTIAKYDFATLTISGGGFCYRNNALPANFCNCYTSFNKLVFFFKTFSHNHTRTSSWCTSWKYWWNHGDVKYLYHCTYCVYSYYPCCYICNGLYVRKNEKQEYYATWRYYCQCRLIVPDHINVDLALDHFLAPSMLPCITFKFFLLYRRHNKHY